MKRYLSRLILAIFYFFISASWLIGQTAQFSFSPVEGNFCAPAKIRFDPVFSEKPDYYYWTFGQNDEESEANKPILTYETPGTYQVKLTVVFRNVIRQVVSTVTIRGSSGMAIQSEKDFLCKPGDNIFTLTTADTLNKVTWKVGNGTPVVSNQQTPYKHTFTNFSSNSITVEGEDKWGCISTAKTVFRVEKLRASIADTLINGCFPANIKFSANISVPSGSSVTRYTWNFDDGSPLLNTTINNATHNFSSADTFVTTLAVTTQEGCENSFSFPPVSLGAQSVLSELRFSSDTICGSEELSISASSDLANGFICEISDGTVYEKQGGKFTHSFKNLGTFQVKVTPISNGCPGIPDSFNVVVRGVIASHAFLNNCGQKNRFTFRNTSSGIANSIQWYFNGSTTPVTSPIAVYVFPEEGRFPFVMIARNNASGCTDSTAGFIYTAKPRFESNDSFVCLNGQVNVEVKDSYTNPRTVYNWNVVGKTFSLSPSPTWSTVADEEGEFTNRVVIVHGSGYCRDTLIQPLKLRVAGPLPNFETIAANCTDENIVFKNKTTSQFGIAPGANWNWDFGNGIKSEEANPAPVVYTTPGSFKVSLFVTDVMGCKDSIRNLVKIRRKPPLKVVPKEMKICQGQEFTLNAFHTNTITWSPSALVDCDTCVTVKVKPDRPTEYRVVTKDSFNCTATDTIKLDVWFPFEWQPARLRDTAVCLGNSVQFNLPNNQTVIKWFPATGLSSDAIFNPISKPERTTTYIATLTDSVGCFVQRDTVVLTIHPLPVADHDSLLVVPFEGVYTIEPKYSDDIVKYTWLHGGALSCGDCPNPSGKAVGSDFFEIQVVSDKGCTSATKINLVIDCSSKNINMPTAFSPDNNGLNDYYYPITRGILKIKRFAVYNRYGQVVFERKNFTPNIRKEGWDGRFNGNLQPAGRYTYWVELLCASGNQDHYKGSFFLLR